MISEELSLNQIIKEPMQLTLQLAARGKYTVSPNPMVGAVILKDNRLIGYGYHLYRGDAHAESKAIDMAGINVEGAILYLNLEPCCHYGLTPPCVDKIIAAKIVEVHFASIDPNPVVQGKSITKLKQAGIEVIIGELKEEAEQLNKSYYYYMENKLPFVIAKWAMTTDGKIGTARDSKWITGEKSRENAHYLRNSVDAILIGSVTAIKDNPSLNVRVSNLANLKQPLKFILGKNLDSLPLDSNLFTINPEKTYLVTSDNFNIEKAEILKKMRVNFLEVKKLIDDSIDLRDLLRKMADLSVSRLLIEGGGYTLAKFLQADLINEFYCYIAAKFIGGLNSIAPFNQDIGVDSIKHNKQAKFTEIAFIGEDVLIQGKF